MKAILSWRETVKKDKHGNHYHNQRKQFFLFFLSIDSMLTREALAVLAQLSQTMAAKMDEPIYHVQGWINGRIAIMFARS